MPVQFFFADTQVTLRNRLKLKKFITSLFRREGFRLANLTYVFCSDAYLLNINQQFLQHDYYTDIISFDLTSANSATEGEIYISIDRVRENAQNLNISLGEELHRVIFHGALHLCGYKDKKKDEIAKMRQAEQRCLELYFK